MPQRGRHARWLVSSGFVVLSLIAAAGPAAARLPMGPSEWVIGPAQRAVFLTFEGPTTTKQLLATIAVLDTKDVRAAFFLPASWLEKHPGAASFLLYHRHLLRNRGYTNERFTALSRSGLRRSIRSAQRVLEDFGAKERNFVRPPHGARDEKVLAGLGRLGYGSLRWTLHPTRGSRSTVEDAAIGGARDGAILSLDLWRASHRHALPSIIDGLRDEGFTFGIVDRVTDARPVDWDARLEPGSRGGAVRFLQERLRALSYDPGATDGVFSEATLQAVYAFEKVNGLPRDGIVSPKQMERIAISPKPDVPKRDETTFIDVDLSRQVLFRVEDSNLVSTLPISSGNGERYVSDGGIAEAHTPVGEFEILWKIPGWRVSDLGELWYPSYFHSAGYAFHGSPSVPPYPASHGCIRLPMHATEAFYDQVSEGTKVFVHR